MNPSTQKENSPRLKRGLTRKALRAIKRPTLDQLAWLANLPDDEEVMNSVQATHLRPTNPGALQRFCKELRAVWDDLAERNKPVKGKASKKSTRSKQTAEILRGWCEAHPLNDPDYWTIDWPNATFFPTEQNWRPLFAWTLFEYRQFAGKCPRQGCNRYFRKKRVDRTFCYDPACVRYGNLQRQKKYLKIHGRKRTA